MIAGSRYLLRGQEVTALAAWNGRRNPDLPRLRERLPLVRTGAYAPHNVMIQHPGGEIEVRPFRGLRAIHDTERTTTP